MPFDKILHPRAIAFLVLFWANAIAKFRASASSFALMA